VRQRGRIRSGRVGQRELRRAVGAVAVDVVADQQVGSGSIQMQLLVFRPTPANGTYTLVGKSVMSTTTVTGVNTFAMSPPLVVSGGDLLGFRPGTGNQLCARTSTSASRYHARLNSPAAPAVGELVSMPTSLTSADVNLSATLESLPVRYNPTSATRVVDTRLGIGAAPVRLAPLQVLTIQVAGVGGVPTTGALAATVNLTTANSAAGYVTAYPCDKPQPPTSSVNPKSSTAVANLANVELSLSGTICVYTVAPTDLIVDVLGWWGTTGLAYNQLSGVRLLDTRASGHLAAGQTVTVQVAGNGGVPGGGATAATLNLTSANSDPGFLTAYPCDQPRPGTSSVNPQAGTAVANLANVNLSAAGTVCIYAETATDLLVDVLGWWGATGSTYDPIDATRGVDTRATGQLAAGQVLTVQLAGTGGVPSVGATGVTVNLTTVNSDPGFVVAYPCDQPRPGTSSVNPQPRAAVANLANVNLSAADTVCIYTETPTDLLIDVLGWWGS
jgi:hypothetical protein